MKVSFGNPENEAPVIDVPSTTTVEAPVASPAPAAPAAPDVTPADAPRPFPEGSLTPVQYAANTGGLVMGDTVPDFKDIILPRLNIVQGVGELKDSFQQGALIFNQSTVLFTPPVINKQTGNVEKAGTPPVVITVLGFRPTRFVEKIEGGGKGLIVNTEAEIRANGGTLDYKEWNLKKAAGMKLFQHLAEALIAIEKPDSIVDDDTVFVYAAEGKKYTLAIWAMKGSAYTAAAKRVFFTMRSLGCLRGGYPTHSFNLTTRLESFNNGKNSAWVPVCVANKKSSPEFLAFVASVLNPAPAQADASSDGSAQ